MDTVMSQLMARQAPQDKGAKKSGRSEQGEKPRAHRFAVSVPLRYRERGQQEWREGRTENISSSGVLFRGHKSSHPRTPIEMSLRFQTNHEGIAEVICRGTLVRVNPEDGTGEEPAMAATIAHYRFIRL